MTERNPSSNHIPKKENAGYMEQPLHEGSTPVYITMYKVGENDIINPLE